MDATAIASAMTEEEKKKLYKKVLWRLIAIIGPIYFFFGFDNLLLSYSALTMRADLGITDSLYGIIGSAGFLAALIFQIPYNIIIKKVGARTLLPVAAIIWSLTSVFLFFANSPMQVALSRFLNGVGDAGFFVCIMYWITLWLPSTYRATFTAIYIAGGSVTAIIGAPLCGIIVDQVNWFGIAGWRWLFFLPSIISLVIGLMGFILIRNRPEDAKWLTDREKATINEDLSYERSLLSEDGSAEETTKSAGETFKMVMTSRTLWHLGFLYFFIQAGINTFGRWMTLIVQGFDPTLTATQIGYISAPMALTSVIFSVWAGAHSDKKKERRWHTILPMASGFVSFILIALPIGLVPKIVVLSLLAAYGFASWYGPYWTLPAALLSPDIVNIGIAVICCMSSLSGFLGNLASGPIVQYFGHTGLLLFLAGLIIIAIVLATTVDYKKVAQVDQGKALDAAKDGLMD